MISCTLLLEIEDCVFFEETNWYIAFISFIKLTIERLSTTLNCHIGKHGPISWDDLTKLISVSTLNYQTTILC